MWAGLAAAAWAQGPANVLVVINDNAPVSRKIGDYYAQRRGIPAGNLCHLAAPTVEEISREVYNREIAAPIGEFLKKGGLTESILYIVTTAGVPLKIFGTDGPMADASSVDSELTLLYMDLKTGTPHSVAGPLPNPFFNRTEGFFSHPKYPMYLVTRLAAYDFEGVKEIIDLSLRAENRGKVVLDMRNPTDEMGNNWLRSAARALPAERVVLDETNAPVVSATDVIGYASWGSNDRARTRRFLSFAWLPGSIATEYVSTNARTFARPPELWNSSDDWNKPKGFYYGSPQSLTADYLLEGATAATGHVYEPYLGYTPRPEVLFPAYLHGRTLAESYYLSIPALSWQNIVVGDPLCVLRRP